VQDGVSEWPSLARHRVPWRLSRSVIYSVGPAGAQFARIAEYALAPRWWTCCGLSGTERPDLSVAADQRRAAAKRIDRRLRVLVPAKSTTFRDELVNNRHRGRCGMRPPGGLSRPQVSQRIGAGRRWRPAHGTTGRQGILPERLCCLAWAVACGVYSPITLAAAWKASSASPGVS
jgi:hypothetical protein